MPDLLDGRAKSIIDRVIDLELHARIEVVERECSGDVELRHRVESLLASMEEDDEFLHQPTICDLSPASDEPSLLQRGTRIGPYTLVELIGEGGFGSVYLAEQSTPVRRQVALKIIKLGMDTKQVIARFEAERQALAMMDHPSIARVLDVGATSAGRPYFVMELVRGENITAYCDQNKLSITQRLQLFREICNAVQHAHQKGVIHRDLKPNNVLVSVLDGRAIPKVIDFGIAKATAGRLTDATLQTELHQIVGTPEYMSPEQAAMTGSDVDTRSDIYSLGVLLYELLTGSAPYDRQRLRSASFAELQRIICEEEPPRPSLRVAAPAEPSSEFRLHTPANVSAAPGSSVMEIAQFRRTDPAPLTRSLRGDLDWIVLKCLEKDRAQRYQSAGALAEDIGRHLAYEPVLATPPSAGYRLRKFVRRNRAAAGAALAIALTLIVAVAVSLTFGIREARQRRDEEHARRQLERVVAFQDKQLSEVSPATMGARLRSTLLEKARSAAEKAKYPPDVVAKRLSELESLLAGSDFTSLAQESLDENVLRPALAAIEREFADQPLVRARLLHTLAMTYEELGMYGPALAQYEQALSLRRATIGDGHADTIASLSCMAVVLRLQGRLTESEAKQREAVETGRRALGDQHPETLKAIHRLGNLLLTIGKLPESERLMSEALQSRRRVLGDEHFDTIESLSVMASVLRAQGRKVEAEQHFREALEKARRVMGDDYPSTITTLNNLGQFFWENQRFAEAEPCFREALERRKRMQGEDHPKTLISMNNMAALLRAQGKLDEADPLHREVLEKQRRILGDDHPTTIVSINNMGILRYAQNRPGEAEPFYREALERRRRALGDSNPDTIKSIHNLAMLLKVMGRLADAEPLYREKLEAQRKAPGDNRKAVLESTEMLAELLKSRDNLAEARAVYADAVEQSRELYGDEHSETLILISTLAGVDEELGRYTDAIAQLSAAESAARRVFKGNDEWKLGLWMLTLGTSRKAVNDLDTASTNLVEALDIFMRERNPDMEDRAVVLKALIEVDSTRHTAAPNQGFDASAAKWRKQLDALNATTQPVSESH